MGWESHISRRTPLLARLRLEAEAAAAVTECVPSQFSNLLARKLRGKLDEFIQPGYRDPLRVCALGSHGAGSAETDWIQVGISAWRPA